MPKTYPSQPVKLTGTPETIRPELDRTFLDTIHTGECGCPGFRLWEVLASNGVSYLVAADHQSGAETRMYLRSSGAIQAATVTLVGENDAAVAEWESTRPWNNR